MISSINNSIVGNTYTKNATLTTQKKESASAMTAEKQQNSKIEQLKESIDSGNYKVDLSALSKKMADELL